MVSPYWGYFDNPSSFYKNEISPLLSCNTEESLADRIAYDWDFFRIDENHRDDIPFRILSYEKEGNHIVITGKSEAKHFKEHREDLKKEFRQKE